MPRHSPIQMTREELYNQVWTVPARQLEKTLGLHNGAVGKLCKKLGVPKPGRGHWELAKQGLKPERPALSLAAGDTPYEITPAAFSLSVDFRSAHPLVVRTRGDTASSEAVSLESHLDRSHISRSTRIS